ncbi:cytochrome P450 [Streptomyces sp. MNU77]|uniref:cytochrome P450 n=1 Tax=Streptomyces sp. MNU77 TaxID=1573406 RepID=UPI000698DBC0|nr:cytochrome P450 [Streptomyces sp. MNU77]
MTLPERTDRDFDERVATFDLHAPELQENPYPFYAEMRGRCPVAHVDSHGGHYVLTRMADIRQVCADARTFANDQVLIPDWEFPLGRQIPGQTNGEEHRLYRLALADLFTPAAVNRLEPRIRATARRLAEEIRDRRGGEFMSDFASPLSSETFLHLFDVDREDLPDLLRFKNLLVHGGAEGRIRLKEDEGRLVDFFAALVERRRTQEEPGADAVSHLLRAPYGDRRLTDEEIINISIVLMLASLDTTSAVTGNVFAWLAEHPDRRDELIADPGLIPRAVEELLRFEGVTGTVRVVTRPTEVNGVPMPAGARVMMLMGAAGRDPEAFDAPDTVDFGRKDVRHATFGLGAHRCLGMHLARRTVKVAIEEFHRVMPHWEPRPGTRPERVLGHVRGVAEMRVVPGDRTRTAKGQ